MAQMVRVRVCLEVADGLDQSLDRAFVSVFDMFDTSVFLSVCISVSPIPCRTTQKYIHCNNGGRVLEQILVLVAFDAVNWYLCSP